MLHLEGQYLRGSIEVVEISSRRTNQEFTPGGRFETQSVRSAISSLHQVPRESSVRTRSNVEVREDDHLSVQLMC